MDIQRLAKKIRKDCGGRFPAFISERAENALKSRSEDELLDCVQQISDRYPALNINLPESMQINEGQNDGSGSGETGNRNDDSGDTDTDTDTGTDHEVDPDSEAELEDLQEFEDEILERDLD